MDYLHQHPVKLDTMEGMLSQIQDGDTVAIGGFWFVRIPVALVDGLVKKGVKNLTVLTHCSGLALDQLIAAKLVKKVIFSFASMDLFGLSPFFRKAIENGEIEWEEWTALQMTQALEAGRQNVPYLPLKPPVGSGFHEETDYYKVMECPFTGETLGLMRGFQPDVALIHAQKADEKGNIQILGSQGMDRLLIGASKQTFVSVEEIVPEGKLDADPRGVIIPHFLINRICQVSGGAYPSSCLPYYIADYWQLQHAMQTAKMDQNYHQIQQPDGEVLGDRLGKLKRFTKIEIKQFESQLRQSASDSADEEEPFHMDELMACLLAKEVKDGVVSTVGSNTPLSMVAYLLAKKTHVPNVVLIPFTGLNDIPAYPITLSLAEVFAYQSSSSHWAIEDLWQWLYQKSLVSVEFGSTAQMDQHGRINNSLIRKAERIKVRLPGQAGLADVINFHHNSLFYITRQDQKRMVDVVDFVSGNRHFVTKDERESVHLADGVLKTVTNYGVFELDRTSRQLVLTHIHPGIDLEDVQANTGFALQVSPDLQETTPPSKEQLRLIRKEIDPFGFRKLEFMAGQERLEWIEQILQKEQKLLFGKTLFSLSI
ncbi:CoA-transferase [Ammoniphilus resinae]|uniref:Glutaconate CoA-transferase subunit A n=1 Tax=Ammoniphilus resinae TaxID=861532 RepID=A0ABS4GWH7_9BACL|nr:CoA-transferase [Ammoniphilus resinae]MBP1934452.1 glutaconate CoA-transferase subunit A [Ammoniphilus resinae]